MLLLPYLCNAVTAGPHKHENGTNDIGNKATNSTLLEEIQGIPAIRETSSDGQEIDTSYDNSSHPAPPYNDSQTMTQNHNSVVEEIITFDVCQPCSGEGKYLTVI